jgi:Tol biopolymer transport system component
MNDPRDPDATIAFWLEDGPQRLPASTKRAIAVTTRTIRQSRRPSWMPWRSLNVNGLMRVSLAATAVVAVAVGALYLTGVNRSPSPPTTGQEPASPSPMASPSSASPVTSPVPDLPGLIAFSRVTLGTPTIMVAAPDGSDLSTLISGPANNVQPAWSADGTEIAWATNGTGGASLTKDVSDRNPAWSPDGSMIVFDSSRDGSVDLYTQLVGGDALVRLTDNDATDGDPSWSAATNQIAFASDRAGTRDIWTMDPNGEGLTQLTGNDGEDDDPAWSPDGTKIAFTSDREGGTPYVYVMNADGSGAERLSAGASAEHDPAWSPDGGFVAFARSEGNSDIVIVDFTTRAVVSTLTKERTESNYPAWRNR